MSAKSPITTHVLDTRSGAPAANLAITLSRRADATWGEIASGVTNADGRIADLLEPGTLTPGLYEMHFDTGGYHDALGLEGFYPEVRITFEIKRVDEHYHVPLLLSPFGYSTYRGS